MNRYSPFPGARVIDYDNLVVGARVHGSIYTDPAIFDEELDRIFHCGWVYVGHDSEIPEHGDFRARHIGRQPVILVRGDDGEVRVLMNRCTHRASVVCNHESGNTKRFTCPYHGWAFLNTGKLLAVPHNERVPAGFNKDDYGLRAVSRVDSYRGLVFASLAEEGVSLDDHLGPLAKAAIDIAFDLSPVGQIEVSVGTHKYGYDGNWKLQAENSTDGYHLGYLHRSFLQIASERAGLKMPTDRLTGRSPFRMRSLGNGHVSWVMTNPPSPDAQLPRPFADYAAAMVQSYGPDRARELLSSSGPHVLIFPNLVFIQTHIRMIRPIAVDRTEVFLYPYRLKEVPDAVNALRFQGHQAFYGPAGGGASDDLEIFERIGEGLRAQLDPWISIERGYGMEEVEESGIVSGQFTDELNNRAILHHWRRLMAGEAELMRPEDVLPQNLPGVTREATHG